MQVTKNQAIVDIEDLNAIIEHCDKVDEHLCYLTAGNVSHIKPLTLAQNRNIKKIVVNKLIGVKKKNGKAHMHK